jgi:hypothetical protein
MLEQALGPMLRSCTGPRTSNQTLPEILHLLDTPYPLWKLVKNWPYFKGNYEGLFGCPVALDLVAHF